MIQPSDGKFLRSIAGTFIPGDGRERIRIRQRLFRLADVIELHEKASQLLQFYADELQALVERSDGDE